MRINDYPDVVNVKGSIVSTDNTNALDQDLLEVELKNGVFIDVGWYPEHDVNGEFFIRVFHENWENQLLAEPFTTKHQDEADSPVKELISRFCRVHNGPRCGGFLRK